MEKYISLTEASELIGKRKETLRRWDREGILQDVREPVSNYRLYKQLEVLSLLGEVGQAKLGNEGLEAAALPENDHYTQKQI